MAARRVDAPLIAGAVAGAVAALCAAGLDGLSDTDPYRHLAYARLLWQSGFTLRGHPFLPQTLLGQSGVDLWWGFHLLMVPFSFLGVLTGARVAGVCIAAAQAGLLAWLIAKLSGRRQAWIFALLPTLTSAYFVARGFSARPGHLTIALVLVNLAAGAGEFGAEWAAGASFLHGLLHLSSPLSPVFALLGAGGSLVAKTPRGGRAVAASVGGLGLAFLLRPDRAHYLSVALIHNLGALGHLPGGRLPGSGRELLPIDMDRFVDETWREVLVFVALAWWGRRSERAGSTAMRWAALIAVAFSAALCFQSGRFLDYLLPSLALAAAFGGPKVYVATPARKAAAVVAGLFLASATPAHIQRAWTFGNAFIAPPESFESLAQMIRSRVPPGTLLVTDDLLLSGVLFSYLPDYQYLCAYDPILLEAKAPAQYWRWEHLVAQGRDCAQVVCRGGEGSGEEVAEALRELGSPWFVSFVVRGDYTVLKPLHENPELFELVGSTPGRAGRMSLWHVRDDRAMPLR